jgi:hypothetical protein
MKQFGLTLFMGTLLSLPLLYVLELNSLGAITLLIFLCVGLAATLLLILGRYRKRGAEE